MLAAEKPDRAAELKAHGDRELLLVHVFDAPRELVFRLWIEPEHFARWCAPAGYEITANDAEPRRGGVWWSVMRGPDGEECRVSGVYREVVAPERLVFTYAHETPAGERGAETRVTVIFEDDAGRTKLTLHQAAFDTVDNRIAHAIGWGACLDRLALALCAAREAP